MTDITELAQREKFEAWARSQKLSLACGDCGYAFSSTEMAWRAWVASSDELVEALEKAQRANAAQGDHIEQQQDRIEQLEKGNQYAANRIAELESRTVTVKLPDIMPPEAAPAHYWGPGESMAYADGYNKSATDLKTSFAQACSSVGVNVEFE